MDTSHVSAFAVYKAKKIENQSKKKRKQKNRDNLNNSKLHEAQILSEEVIRQGAKKHKDKLKKSKEPKNIAYKKAHKKVKQGKIVDKMGQFNCKKAGNEKDEIKPEKGEKKKIVNGHKILDRENKFPTLTPINVHDVYNMQNSDDIHQALLFIPVRTDSRAEAMKVFRWMIAPYDPKEFFNRIWETKPLHIARNKPDYYKDIISTPIIDDMLRNENIQYGRNVDITSYVNNVRETHNPEGRAHPHLVWDFYLNGCSIRLLNPQTYIKKLHLMLSMLQEHFNSMVGANAYLTPPDSQGFAPHYDDIEAFILQAEGKKHWRIYQPRNEWETLPRYSSKNLSQDEIGKPIMELTLEAGDMLYFPRGYIHQGVTIDGQHSLHVTISMCQNHSWADLFETMIPHALETAMKKDVNFRKGLPFDIYDKFGFCSDKGAPHRQPIEKMVSSLFTKLKDYICIDTATDQMHKGFQHDALPPVLSEMEKAVTVYGDSDVMVYNGKVINRVEMDLDTNIRLLRKNIVRLVHEENSFRLYTYAENSLEYHGQELTFTSMDKQFVKAVEGLIKAYPEYISVESLRLADDADKIKLADALWSRGIIMTELPMQTIED